MKKRTKTALRITALVLLAALMGLSVYTINAERLNGNVLPMPLGVGATVVMSGSMEPTLSAGDLLIVVRAKSYAVGDVVVYQSGGMGVVHRIVEIDGRSVITKGDANNTADEPIELSRIKGAVAFSLPGVGYGVNLIKTPVVTVILLALAILLMEGSLRKDKKADRARIEAMKAEIERLKSTNK